jgi:hypothetical protein
VSAEDACSGADMSEPQIRDFTTRHSITAREAIKAVMHPAGILVRCTCDPIVALGERRGEAPTFRPALLLDQRRIMRSCYGKRTSARWLAADHEER